MSLLLTRVRQDQQWDFLDFFYIFSYHSLDTLTCKTVKSCLAPASSQKQLAQCGIHHGRLDKWMDISETQLLLFKSLKFIFKSFEKIETTNISTGKSKLFSRNRSKKNRKFPDLQKSHFRFSIFPKIQIIGNYPFFHACPTQAPVLHVGRSSRAGSQAGASRIAGQPSRIAWSNIIRLISNSSLI